MKSYWLGDFINDQSWKMEVSWSTILKKRLIISSTPLNQILDLLDSFALEWAPETACFKTAVPELVRESDFSEREVVATLSLLQGLLSRESLEKRVMAEFGNKHVLDRFSKTLHFDGLVRALPKGVLLHVTAGNVFLSSIDSLMMGFLTKNLSIVKVSSQNTFFPLYFAEKLKQFDKENILADKFSILHWKGGEEVTEKFIKSRVDTIIAWGGEEMIQSYRKDLPPNVKFLDFGPKISIQLISSQGLKGKDLSKVAEAIVKDIIPWDQGACASPQNLFLEDGIDEMELIEAIDKAFSKAPPRGKITDDEAVEILKEKYRALFSTLMEGGAISEGKEHLIHAEKNKFLKPSPLGRSLIIKRFSSLSDLVDHLSPFSYYLQSCSYLLASAEKEAMFNHLGMIGIKRFSPLGTITWGMEGAPHDGRLVLRELVNFVGDEARIQDYGQSSDLIQFAATLKKQFESTAHPAGYIFSSGGTTGDPKYVHYSYEEFDRISDMLAFNFKAQGIRPGTTVANLFVAGNLWSSFIAVEKALEKTGAIQLPIGGMCPGENILTYLTKFRPHIVMGIPSMLVVYAELAEKLGIEIEVEKVFYAGEPLSEARREYLRKVWKTKYFGSAGYASVDAGVIGYQCDQCGPGEHHLFTDMVDMKIVNGEALISSLSRNTLEISNYASGDRVEWISDCSCGRKDKRFKLLGRIDNTILVWSCRLQLDGIEKAIKKINPEILSFQIQLTERHEAQGIKELMVLTYEAHKDDVFKESDFIQEVYQTSRDLKDTISFETFCGNLKLNRVNPGDIKRNQRTGKISVIQDLRK